MDHNVLSRLGGYRVVRRLGAGACAEVFLAERDDSGQRVALKVMDDALADEPGAAERFRQEAEIAMRLVHPHVVRVREIGECEGRPFLVMDFVDGESLEVRIARGTLTTAEAIPIATACLEALQAAHDRGIVHRDIKPSNILLGRDGSVFLTDFGLAKVAEHSSLTRTGMIVGTAAYMSPEQCSGRHIDARSDLYSFGVTLFEMLSGKLPFESAEPLGLIYQHQHEPPRELPRGLPGINDRLAEAVMRLLAKSPEERFQNVSQVLGALHAATSDRANVGERQRADARPLVGSGKKSRARLTGLVMGSAFVVALIAAGVNYFATASHDSGIASAKESPPIVDGAMPVAVVVPPAEIEPEELRQEVVVVQPPVFRNSVDMELRWISAGSFQMGNLSKEPPPLPSKDPAQEVKRLLFSNDRPAHRVTISHGFYMGTCEVTREEFSKVMQIDLKALHVRGEEPGNRTEAEWGNWPVTGTNWHDAVEFCRRLSARFEERTSGRIYRLPTEAEWEYACRAGTETIFPWGDDPQASNKFAWSQESSGGFVKRAGQLEPNAWGFRDMVGNTYEWCQDLFESDYYAHSPASDPLGPAVPRAGRNRVIRGASCLQAAGSFYFHSSHRSQHPENSSRSYIGFRVVAIPTDASPNAAGAD